jgi:hypothetical protein
LGWWLIGWWIELLVGGVELVGGLPGWLVELVQNLIGGLAGLIRFYQPTR